MRVPDGVPKDDEGQRFFLKRMLTDTGFFCRNVLQMHTDRNQLTGEVASEVGKGGIRDYGPHQEFVSFLDDEKRKTCVLMAPRYSYKSSIVQGFILRNILARPNISILMFMHKEEMATKRCRGIRDILEQNEIIRFFFGDLKGPSWTQGSFVTSLRTDMTLQSPTLWAASPEKSVTGGRPNLVVFDDIVDEVGWKTEVGLKRPRECVSQSLALAARDTRYIDVGTPYHPGDAHHWCLDAGWDRLILNSGLDVVEDENKVLRVQGEARWPNLPTDFLQGHLDRGMEFQFFMSQFQLQVVSGLKQKFQRTHFHPCAWRDDEHQDLSGYLLTDIAPSGSEGGDLNVLMYVGFDERNRVYLLDLQMGFWLMYEFCERAVSMLQKWQAKVNHRRELWEKSLSFHGYQQHMHVLAKQKHVRLDSYVENRNQTVLPKDERISSLGARFQTGEVNVMDTLPRTWNAGTQTRSLWMPEDPECHDDAGRPLPGGDLVEQFIRFPHHTKKDIPDTLSLINSIDKATQALVCSWARPSHHRISDAVRRKRVREPARSNATDQNRDGSEPRLGSADRFYARQRRSN